MVEKILYYICADDHLMTSSKITHGEKTIYQIVMGTGGTKLYRSNQRECT
jgi:hypothetical protein